MGVVDVVVFKLLGAVELHLLERVAHLGFHPLGRLEDEDVGQPEIPRGKTHPVAVEHRDVEEKFIGQVVVRRVGEPADGHVLVDFFDRRFRFGGLHKGTGAFDGGVLPGPLRTAARQAEEQRAEERDGSFQGGSLPSGRFGTF